MKNYNEIHLSDLTSNLQNTHVQLDLTFLGKLLKNASKSENPAMNKEFVLKIGCCYNENEKRCTTFGSWFNNNSAMSFKTFSKIVSLSNYSLNEIEKYIITIMSGRTGSKVFLKFPIKLSKEFGSVVGHILGDGSIDRKYLQPFYTNSNIDLIKEFANNMGYVFGVKPRIWTQAPGNFSGKKSKWLQRLNSLENIPTGRQIGLFYPKICGVILHSIFGLFAHGKKKQITEQIKQSNKKFKIGLISAFFDDEASIQSYSHTIRFHQDSEDILEGIKFLLSDFNIKTNPIRFYIKKNKRRCYFNITGFREYYNFYHIIGCTSFKKNREFQILIDKVANSRSFKKKFAL